MVINNTLPSTAALPYKAFNSPGKEMLSFLLSRLTNMASTSSSTTNEFLGVERIKLLNRASLMLPKIETNSKRKQAKPKCATYY